VWLPTIFDVEPDVSLRAKTFDNKAGCQHFCDRTFCVAGFKQTRPLILRQGLQRVYFETLGNDTLSMLLILV